MKITFDPTKRARTLADRSLDFADAVEVFAGKALNIPDERREYLASPGLSPWDSCVGVMVIVVWTPRGNGRHIISMRKAKLTGKKRALGSDLKKVDRHVIQPHEY